MNPKFSHKHYVPILKTKAGERWAISHLHQHHRDGLTPLWEIHESRNSSLSAHIPKTCQQTHEASSGLPFFVDPVWLHHASGSPSLIAALFNNFRTLGSLAIPVVHLSYDIASLDAIQDVILQDNRGYLLRVGYEEVVQGNAISSVTNYLNFALSDVHFLLDYGKHSMDLPSGMSYIPYVADWRTVTAASGVFPATLAHLPRRAWNSLPRYCWQTWESAVLSGRLPRKPTFSDYSIRDPGRPGEFGAASTNVRYVADNAWQAQLRGKLADGLSGDMRLICQDLIQQGFYSGSHFSEGDRIFNELALGNLTTGAGKEWVQWSANHHLAFVSNQIQAHVGL